MSEVIDEPGARRAITLHARALQAGDLEAAAGCLDDDRHAQWQAIVAQLPRSIHYVELARLERVDGAVVALVRYAGDGLQTTVQQRWELRRGRPTIVEARVVPTRVTPLASV
jgi:hypothetical protein